jgi:hypothetical protein
MSGWAECFWINSKRGAGFENFAVPTSKDQICRFIQQEITALGFCSYVFGVALAKFCFWQLELLRQIISDLLLYTQAG